MSASGPQFHENITPVFGLTGGQLRPIVASIAGEPVASFRVTIEHQVRGPYGIRGEKLVPTFIYTTCSGHKGRSTVFVKRQREHYPGHAEAHQYAYLEKHQAPIPRMYGALTDPDRREILFLEYLDAVTDEEPCQRFLKDGDQFPQFLSVMAHFNAIQPSPEYAARLRQDMAQRPGPPSWSWNERLMAAASVLKGIAHDASRGQLGDPLKGLCSEESLSRLRRLARGLVKPINRMTRGLCLNDCYPHCTGWRRETGELLVFDLESVGFAPRFYDVAPWLGAPDDVQPRCRPREELAQVYLQHYAHWGGCSVPVDQFLEETRNLWMAWTLTNLGWWRDRALQGPLDPTQEDSEGYCCAQREELHRQLTILLRQVSELRGRSNE